MSAFLSEYIDFKDGRYIIFKSMTALSSGHAAILKQRNSCVKMVLYKVVYPDSTTDINTI